MKCRTVPILLGYYFTLALFGVCGVVIGFLSLPCAALPVTDRRERFFQRVIHRFFAGLIWWVRKIGIVEVRFHGFERLAYGRPGVVFVANHPSLVDVTCLLARIPEAICIFKPAIRRNPILGVTARLAGYIANDGGVEVLRQAANRVAAGKNLVIFPEGTRTPIGEPVLPFKRGFVVIARKAGASLQLVRLHCPNPLLGKGRPWWKLPPISSKIDVVIGPRLVLASEAKTTAAAAEIEAWFRATPDAAACHAWSPALRVADFPSAS